VVNHTFAARLYRKTGDLYLVQQAPGTGNHDHGDLRAGEGGRAAPGDPDRLVI